MTEEYRCQECNEPMSEREAELCDICEPCGIKEIFGIEREL